MITKTTKAYQYLFATISQTMFPNESTSSIISIRILF
jgi:hypothetical protein